MGVTFWRRKPVDPLDVRLLRWGASDGLTVRQLLNGGIVVLGRTGAGKTSSSGFLLGWCVVNAMRSGGLILAAKPEDVAMWRRIFANRPDDLIVIEPGGKHQLNVLSYLCQQGADTQSIVRCLLSVGETLRSGESGADDSAFFDRLNEQGFYTAVEALRQAYGRVSAPDIQRFIVTAAETSAMKSSEAWQREFHNQTLRRAFLHPKTPRQQHDYDLCKSFWLDQWPGMADRTKTSALAGMSGLLHTLCTGLVREMLSEGTTVTPDDMLAGKWVVVNCPPALYGDAGTVVNTTWKFVTQWRVLRREVKPGDPVVVVFADEAHLFSNNFDAHYLAQSRSRLGCSIYLTQSVASFYAAMKGRSAEHQAKALLANFATAVVHACDPETAEWASSKVGRKLTAFFGGSMQPGPESWDSLIVRQQFGGSFNQQYEVVLEPSVLMNNLRTGGPTHGFLCDGIVLKSGELFSNGESYLRVAFPQK